MNHNNLRALAKFLRELVKPEKFNMNVFFADENERQPGLPDVQREDYHKCGTCACALGYGPLLFEAQPNETWYDFCRRVFGVEPYSEEWEFIFSVRWAPVDNTPEGAAKRIEYALDHGAPDEDETWAMQHGREELCYV